MEGLIVREVDFKDIIMSAVKTDKGVFVALKPLCKELGIDANAQMQRIARDEVLVEGICKINVPTNGGEQEMNFLDINMLPMWLVGISTSQVREEVRECIKEFRIKARDILAQAFIEEKFQVPKNFKEALILAVAQQEQIEQLELKVEIDKPKVEFYDTVTESATHLDFAEVAKIINRKDMGRNNLMKFLRNKKVLRDNNVPYQQYVNQGYFKLTETHYVASGEVCIGIKTVVLQKGVDFIIKILKEENNKSIDTL